jgi:hypothetical protein
VENNALTAGNKVSTIVALIVEFGDGMEEDETNKVRGVERKGVYSNPSKQNQKQNNLEGTISHA